MIPLRNDPAFFLILDSTTVLCVCVIERPNGLLYTCVWITFSFEFSLYSSKIVQQGHQKTSTRSITMANYWKYSLVRCKTPCITSQSCKTYGPIMSLKLGQITTVVISSPTIAKQALKDQDQAFSTRFVPNAVQEHNYCKYSVGWLPVCPRWRTLRKILNTNIFSHNRLDANKHLRSQKVKELIAYCEKCCQEGKVVDVGQVAFKTSLNLLSNTLFSKDLADPFSDSKVELREVIQNIIAEMAKPNLVDFFPILEKIDIQGIRRRIAIYFGKLFDLFDGLINKRLDEKRGLCNQKTDVLEVLLNICEENPEEMINHKQIKIMFMDLISAGTDTTTSTLEWAMT